MSAVFLTGASGRLGTVIAQTLYARGDTLTTLPQGANYLVFSHRYRGEPDFALEMEANVHWVAKCIATSEFGEGDKAIVLVSSINATDPEASQSLAYNLSKASLNNLARLYAKTLPIRINTVSPATFTGDNPQVSAQEVANVIAFLCSPQASGINGQDIRVTR